jgi:hypothetical protein
MLRGMGRPTATVKSIDLAAFMDQAAIDYVLAVRVLHVSSIIMTHAVGTRIIPFTEQAHVVAQGA